VSDPLVSIDSWAEAAAIVAVVTAVGALAWRGVRAAQAESVQKLAQQLAAAEARAANAERAIEDVDKRLTEVEKTMATRADLQSLREDLQTAVTQIHAALDKSSERTIREMERLLQFATRGQS
jgi:hypothetical protein